jgi:hypothetical protein
MLRLARHEGVPARHSPCLDLVKKSSKHDKAQSTTRLGRANTAGPKSHHYPSVSFNRGTTFIACNSWNQTKRPHEISCKFPMDSNNILIYSSTEPRKLCTTWNKSLQAYGSLILDIFSPFLHIEQYDVFSL